MQSEMKMFNINKTVFVLLERSSLDQLEILNKNWKNGGWLIS